MKMLFSNNQERVIVIDFASNTSSTLKDELKPNKEAKQIFKNYVKEIANTLIKERK